MGFAWAICCDNGEAPDLAKGAVIGLRDRSQLFTAARIHLHAEGVDRNTTVVRCGEQVRGVVGEDSVTQDIDRVRVHGEGCGECLATLRVQAHLHGA